MTLSFSIGKIAGIDIRIHLTLFLVLPILSYFFFSTPYPYGFRNVEPENLRILVSIIATFSLFASVLIHELSHSLLSKKYGVKVQGIVLFVFGGVSLLEDVPSETEKEVIIANSPKSCFRETFSIGYLNEEETIRFLEMTDKRNATSHTYKEEVAEAIYASLKEYTEAMENLLTKFSSINSS